MRNGLLVVLALLVGCGSEKPDDAVSGSAAAGTNLAGSASPQAADAAAKDPAVDAEPLLRQADALIAKREWQRAIDLLNAIVKQVPDSAAAHFKRAGILADVREDRAALADFTQAIQLAPQNAQYHNMRGFFLLTRKAYPQAVADFSKAIELDPKYKQPRNNRGLALVSLGKYEEAIEDFNQAIRLDDEYVDAYNNRGFAFFSKEDYTQAASDFERAIEIDPDYINAYNNHGLLRMKTKGYEDAIADFTQAIQRDPQNSKYYLHRREAHLAMGQHERAEQDAEKVMWLSEVRRLNNAVAEKPESAQNHIQLAEALVRGGKEQVAQAHFAKAIDAAPEDAQSYLSRAGYWFGRGEFQKCIEDCGSALEHEESPDAHSLRGEAYLRLEDFDNAIAEFESAQRIDLTVADAYFRRAKLLEDRGQSDAARRDLEHAYRLNPALRPAAAVADEAGQAANP